MGHGLISSTTCGIFLDQGWAPCPRCWQVILIHCTAREVPHSATFNVLMTFLPSYSQSVNKFQNLSLQNMFRIESLLTTHTVTMLMQATTISHLFFFNGLLIGFSAFAFDNTVARVFLKYKLYHAILILWWFGR